MINNSGTIRDPNKEGWVLFHPALGVGSGRGMTEQGSLDSCTAFPWGGEEEVRREELRLYRCYHN